MIHLARDSVSQGAPGREAGTRLVCVIGQPRDLAVQDRRCVGRAAEVVQAPSCDHGSGIGHGRGTEHVGGRIICRAG